MAKELQAETNRLVRLFDKFQLESKAVGIAAVSVVVSLLALLMAFMALDSAKDAKMRAEYQDRELEAQDTELRIYRNRAGRLDAYLKAKGVPIEEIYNELDTVE